MPPNTQMTATPGQAGWHIAVESGLCSRFRSTRSPCTRCVDVCPAEALRVSERGVELLPSCAGCGACWSACPNGALQPRLRGDAAVALELADALGAGSAREGLSFTCTFADTPAHVTLPCLGRLTEGLILEAFRRGAARVEVRQPECLACCPWRKAARQIPAVLASARGLCDVLGIDEGRIEVTSVPYRSGTSARPEPAASRRELLRAAVQGTAMAAAEAAVVAAEAVIPAPFRAEPEEEGATFRETVQAHPNDPKRAFLLEVLRGFPTARKVAVEADGALLADLTVGPSCAGCNVCQTLCPTGAIRREETAGRFALDYQPSLCTNCRICVAACLPAAIQAREKVDLALLVHQTPRRLFEAIQRTCPTCRDTFAGQDDEFCPMCRDRTRRRKVMLNLWLSDGRMR